jgi:hypothetical protein
VENGDGKRGHFHALCRFSKCFVKPEAVMAWQMGIQGKMGGRLYKPSVLPVLKTQLEQSAFYSSQKVLRLLALSFSL